MEQNSFSNNPILCFDHKTLATRPQDKRQILTQVTLEYQKANLIAPQWYFCIAGWRISAKHLQIENFPFTAIVFEDLNRNINAL